MKSYNITKQQSWFRSLINLFFNKQLSKIYILIVIAWFFYAQMFSLAPILIANKYNLTGFIWLVAFINGITVVLFAIKLNKFIAKFNNLYVPIVFAFILATIGFSCLLFINSIYGVIVGVFIISLAEIMFIPGFQVILGKVVTINNQVAIFAINAICVGVGEGFGYYYGTITGLNNGHIYMMPTISIYAILFFGLCIALNLLSKQRVL